MTVEVGKGGGWYERYRYELIHPPSALLYVEACKVWFYNYQQDSSQPASALSSQIIPLPQARMVHQVYANWAQISVHT